MAYQRRGSFGLVPLPQAGDPLRSLSEMASLADIPQQKKLRDLQIQNAGAELDLHKQATADKQSLDYAYSPQATLPPGAQGPMPANAPGPTRDQILAATPGHLKGQVQKNFDEADKAATEAKAAKEKAAEAEADYFGYLGTYVKSQQYNPQAADAAMAHAEEQGHDMKPMREALARGIPLEQIVDASIEASPKYSKLEVDAAREAEVVRHNQNEEFAKATELTQKAQQAQQAKSIDLRIQEADQAGNPKEVQRLLGIKNRMAVAGHVTEQSLSPEELSSSASAVIESPTLFLDLTPGRRDQLIAPLKAAGFDFNSVKNLTPAQKATIERWKSDALQKLAADKDVYTEPGAYDAEKNRIEESYKLQMGDAGKAPAKATPGGVPANVQSFLSGKKSGTYVLKNNQGTYSVAEDGTITRTK